MSCQNRSAEIRSGQGLDAFARNSSGAWDINADKVTGSERQGPRGSFLKGLCRLRPVLVFRYKARPRGFTWLAYPDLAIWVQTRTAGGGNGAEPRAVQQAGVGYAAVRMQAAVGRHRLVPGRLARLENGRI
jgi:hypothetical protein